MIHIPRWLKLWFWFWCDRIAPVPQLPTLPALPPKSQPEQPDLDPDQPDTHWSGYLPIPPQLQTFLESEGIALSVIETDNLAVIILGCQHDLPHTSYLDLIDLARSLCNATRIPLCVLRSPQQQVKLSLAGDFMAMRIDDLPEPGQ